MNGFAQDLSLYMAELASKHRDLLHQPDDRHFFRGELDEFFSSFKSEVRFPCLILEGFSNEYRGDDNNAFRLCTTGFIIADTYPAARSYDQIQEVFDRCERIGIEVIGRMMRDGDEDPACIVAGLDLESVTARAVQNEAKRYAGVRFEFVIEQPVCLYNKNAWND